MMARVPASHIPLSEAVIKAALAWHGEEIDKAGLSSDEFTMMARHWFALARVRQSERNTKDAREGIRRPGARVRATQQDREEAGVTARITEILERGRGLADLPTQAWDRLRDMLLAGQLRACLFSDQHGRVEVPATAWGRPDADPAHERSAMRFHLGMTMLEGPTAIPGSELDSAVLREGSPASNSEPRVGTVTPARTSMHHLPDGLTRISPDEGGPKAAQRKATPALDRAQEAIVALYPDGVPNQTEVTNKELETAVSRYLEENYPKQVRLSKDTIIRAAGRRK